MPKTNFEEELCREKIRRRIRSHTYNPNPIINEYLVQQQRRSETDVEQTIVRERRPSGVSIASSVHSRGDDQMVCLKRCMTPVPDHQKRYELNCIICHFPAINPFRCTRIDERDGIVLDNQKEGTPVYHICCYKCLGTNMILKMDESFECPVCLVNEFNLDNLIHADPQLVLEAESLVMTCPNNCGLFGSPLAMANHICVFQGRKMLGHTKKSNELVNLTKENRQRESDNLILEEKLSRVTKNIEIMVKTWRITSFVFFAVRSIILVLTLESHK